MAGFLLFGLIAVLPSVGGARMARALDTASREKPIKGYMIVTIPCSDEIKIGPTEYFSEWLDKRNACLASGPSWDCAVAAWFA